MTLFVIFLTSFVTGFSGAASPGPLLTVTISESYKRGFWAGPFLVLGHGILESSLVVGLIFGLGTFLKQKLVFSAVGVFGGLILLWMGYGIIRDSLRKKIIFSTSVSTNPTAHPVITGIVTSLSNPYWFLWWASIGMALLGQGFKWGVLGAGVFFVGHILSDLVWYSLVSFVVYSGTKILSDRIYQGILLACGAFLIGLSAYFIYSGTGNFLKGA